ncbi:hypothetical protein DFH11DRAFT_1705624 [Phellopilus nigrolimitatus]|nr:hypothetical protein DFH11DRAFT_1705624 [Phellopilus nigrolimitatus]
MPAQSDARLSDREQDALVSRFQVLFSSEPDRVVRSGVRERCAAIVVPSDLALKYPKDVVLYDYPAMIAPDVVSSTVRKRVFELPESTPEVAPYPHGIAHDGTQRFVSRNHPPADFSATVSEGPEQVYIANVLKHKEPKSADLDRIQYSPPTCGCLAHRQYGKQGQEYLCPRRVLRDRAGPAIRRCALRARNSGNGKLHDNATILSVKTIAEQGIEVLGSAPGRAVHTGLRKRNFPRHRGHPRTPA